MRLIDADRLLQGYEDHDFMDTHIIWNAPTVEAIPVVRCKDCKHYDVGENDIECWTWCEQHEMHVDEDFFCRDGKRKEECSEQFRKKLMGK